MRCIVTGKETNNKWKGKPVCKDVVIAAKEIKEKDGGTMRKALIKVGEEVRKAFNESQN